MRGSRRIAVIGSNSFSGSDFIDLLLEDPQNDVLGISRSPENSALFLPYKRHENASFRFEQCNLNQDMPKLLSALDEFQPWGIVNFAAQSEVGPSWDHPEHWFQTNTVSLAVLVNHLRNQSYLKRYVHISSPEAYGDCVGTVTEETPDNPSTPYAASKSAADMLLSAYQTQFGFPLLTVRATNVYGAHQQLFKIIPRSVIYIKTGTIIQLHGGGRAVKSYIHIRDVSRGELAILENGTIGERYHLSPDSGVAVRDVVRTIAERMGKSLEDVSEDVIDRPGQDAAYVIDSTKARTQLGWASTVDLEIGLTEVVNWAERNWDEIQKEPLEYVHRA
jgi:dTDP-glucose 4,6-dehydratase